MWWGGGWAPVQRLTALSLENEWTRAFIDRGRGLRAETAESALTVILKFIIGVWLTSSWLSIVVLQFQGWFVPITRDPFSELWQLISGLQSGHHVFLLPGGVFSTYKTAHRIWLRILSAGSQREELRPWQKSWGKRFGICKGVIKLQEPPCSQASTPKARVCFMLSPTPLTLRGALPHHHFSRRRS